jgi:hypothetical protein
VATDAPSLAVTAYLAAAPVRQLRARRDLPIATDLSAEPGEAVFEQPAAGADAV